MINPHGPNSAWLELLAQLDRGRWSDLELKVAQMDIPMSLVDSAAIEAAMWTDEVMGSAS